VVVVFPAIDAGVGVLAPILGALIPVIRGSGFALCCCRNFVHYMVFICVIRFA